MKTNQFINIGLAGLSIIIVMLSPACQKFDYSDFNNPSIGDDTADANTSVLQTLVTGTESNSRTYLPYYIDDVGVVGREHVRFSNSEPRYLSDLLGSGNSQLNNNTFYITNPWAFCYATVKDANILISAARNSTQITDGQRLGYYGFAKTFQAYQMLMVLNLTQTIRTNVTDPNNLGPLNSYEQSLSDIAALLDEASEELQDPTAVFSFQSTIGFTDPPGFLKFNRALASRVAAYRKLWNDVLNDLNGSFLDKGGDFYLGAYHIFANAANDITNPLFFPRNATGEVRCAEPHYATDILPGDDRINKAPLRDEPYSQAGITCDRDIFIYPTNTSPVAIIRNEELILLSAEAEINLGQTTNAVSDLNIIRTAHGLTEYTGATDQTSLINELLYERRYSLAFEGHRWVDLRRYNMLDILPLDRPDDHIWTDFPIPLSETH